MEVIDFEPAMTAEWNAFVQQHPLAGYGHLAATMALAAETPGTRNASLVVREGQTLTAVMPLFEFANRAVRVIPVRELLSAGFFPAGPLISCTANGKAQSKILELLAGAVRERGAAAGVDRVGILYPTVCGGQPASQRFAYSPLLHYGYRARPGVGLLLDLSRPLDELAASRDDGCRRNIKKAEAAGARTGIVRDRAEWMSCHGINVQTLGELAYSEQQLAAIWDHYIAPGLALAHAVSADGSIAAVNVTIRWNGSAYYWIGWNRRPPVRGASHLAMWSAILAAREHGCRYFELGSLEFENPRHIGISRFKQSFGGVPCPTIGAELELKPLKSAAVALAQAAVETVRRSSRNRTADPVSE